MWFVVEGYYTNSMTAISSVNDCTGKHFESSRIALTGNEKSISIAARARSDSQLCTQGKRS